VGNALLLGSVCCEAAYVVLGKRLATRASPMRLSAAINLCGLALMTPLGIWQWSQPAFDALTVPVWGLLVFYAIAASLVTVWLWLSGLKTVPANHAGVFTIALPLAATAVGVIAFGEHLGPRHVLSLALGLASIAVISRRRPYEVCAH
jgi:drug/metabolite transporter (DMT)-like permease